MGPAVFSNIAPVLLGNPTTFVVAVAVRLLTAWAGLKGKRVNKCAPYFPVPYAGHGPARVQGFAVPVEEHWPFPREHGTWNIWNAFDQWCAYARGQASIGGPIALPVLTPAQRARWSQIRGGVLWLYSGQVVPSFQLLSRRSVGFLGARQVRAVRF